MSDDLWEWTETHLYRTFGPWTLTCLLGPDGTRSTTHPLRTGGPEDIYYTVWEDDPRPTQTEST